MKLQSKQDVVRTLSGTVLRQSPILSIASSRLPTTLQDVFYPLIGFLFVLLLAYLEYLVVAALCSLGVIG